MPAGREPDRPVVVVKLGGAVITRKRDVERARPKVIARLARELASVGDRRLVVLHGAGSFGHPGARRFGLARPPTPGEAAGHRARGAAIVAGEVRRLHLTVLRALIAAGLPAWSVPVATHARNREGRLERIDVDPFSGALERGLVPVSFGDVVPDTVWEASILSADTVAVELARTLRPGRVLFVSDVPGVLGEGAAARRTVVPELTDAVVGSLRPRGGAPDVTGGIRAKAEAMLAIARTGVEAGLISGLTDGALARAVRGEKVYGSWARARSG